MKIVLLDEAQERFEAEDRWWREHRDAVFYGASPGGNGRRVPMQWNDRGH